jgi:hypothetical protein
MRLAEVVSAEKKKARRAAVQAAVARRVRSAQEAPGHYEKALERWKDKRRAGAQDVRSRMKRLIAMFEKD